VADGRPTSNVVTSSDLGSTIRVEETATNAAGSGVPSASAATRTIVRGSPSSVVG
jgi:hypothetical protein